MATSERYFYGTGRRKTAVARVRLYPGTGEILVNGKGYLDVFTRGTHQNAVLAPLRARAALSAGTYRCASRVGASPAGRAPSRTASPGRSLFPMRRTSWRSAARAC